MSNVIKLKRGTSAPTTSDIVDGEIAVDTSAKKLYVNDSGTVKEIGGGSGGLTSDAQGNTVGGTNAGDSFSGTSALRNTLIGYNAGTAVETGDDNTFLGYNAGAANGAGGGNTFIGQKAGESNLGAQQSVAVGSYALASQNHNSHEGSSAVGYYSLYSQTSGKLNTALGRFAGYNCSEGEKNVFLGNLAGYGNITTGSNNIIIGHEATASSATVDNEITFGDTNITKFRIPGLNFVIKDTTATEDYVLTVDSNGEAGWAAASGGGGSGDITGVTAGTALTGGGSSGDVILNADVGIGDDKLVQMDDADAADDDYAKFTANGLEGRSTAEVKTDLSLNNVENTAVSTWAGSSNITTLGTVSTVTSTAVATAGVRKIHAGTTTPGSGLGSVGDLYVKY